MKFKALNGYLSEDSSFISICIEGGNNRDSIGDQIWISKDGTEMQVYDCADNDVLREAANLFDGRGKQAFKGAMRRMGIVID